MLDRIVLIEEPFSHPADIDVHGLPARFAGDESIENRCRCTHPSGAGIWRYGDQTRG